jgi:hypothetical protein
MQFARERLLAFHVVMTPANKSLFSHKPSSIITVRLPDEPGFDFKKISGERMMFKQSRWPPSVDGAVEPCALAQASRRAQMQTVEVTPHPRLDGAALSTSRKTPANVEVITAEDVGKMPTKPG